MLKRAGFHCDSLAVGSLSRERSFLLRHWMDPKRICGTTLPNNQQAPSLRLVGRAAYSRVTLPCIVILVFQLGQATSRLTHFLHLHYNLPGLAGHSSWSDSSQLEASSAKRRGRPRRCAGSNELFLRGVYCRTMGPREGRSRANRAKLRKCRLAAS
jgi:hypothetical protein